VKTNNSVFAEQERGEVATGKDYYQTNFSGKKHLLNQEGGRFCREKKKTYEVLYIEEGSPKGI